VGTPRSPTSPPWGPTTHLQYQGHTTTSTVKQKVQSNRAGCEKLAPPMGLQPPLRWAWRPLSVPCRSGTPAHRLQVRTRSRVCFHPLPHTLWLRTLPPCQGGLRACHVSLGPGPRLPTEVSYEATMCPSALDLASLWRWAPVLPCVPWLWALLSRA
jgi:hypothetical protein